MPVRRVGAGHDQHLTCERAYSGYEIDHNAELLILIRCKHSQRAARSFMRGLEIRLYRPAYSSFTCNLVARACDPWEGTDGSGIIRCRKPGILAKIELRIPFQRPIRFLPETDYPRTSRSFPRIAGSGNEIASHAVKL
jgi:hypothetical protein